MRVGSLGWGDPLEEEMAIHSSTLSRKTSGTEEPGGLQSIGLQRIGHNCAQLFRHVRLNIYIYIYIYVIYIYKIYNYIDMSD